MAHKRLPNHKKASEKNLYPKNRRRYRILLSFLFEGRIAQLVERLSYTQVVIGSSPFAPNYMTLNAGVVQLVRAPPCHGGSCGFEPRLPRIFP